MNMLILNYIIQPLLGGAAGYITNDYAINMLFNSYTPLKIGGVIPKTRNEFIENISKLIEEDIITREKVETILNDKVFIDNFNKLIEDFYENSLYEVADNINIENIPCLNSCVENIKGFKDKEIKLSFFDVTCCILKNINPDEIIDKKQIDNIIISIYDYIFKLISITPLIDTLIANYSQNNIQLSLKDILGNGSCEIIKNNISNILINQKNYIADFDIKIDEILTKTKTYDLIFNTLKELVQNNSDKISSLLNQLTNKYIDSEKGQESVLKLCNSITLYIKSVNIKLSDILNVSYKESLKNIINLHFNDIAKILLNFVNDNSLDIKHMINLSVEETINEQDAAKKSILNMAKGTILSKLEQFDIEDIVKKFVNNPNSIDYLADLICNKVDDFLNNTTIGELVETLEDKVILTDKKLCGFIIQLIKSNTHNLSRILSDNILKFSTNDTIRGIITPKIVQFVKNNIICSKTFDKLIENKAHQYIDKLFENNINDIVVFLNNNNINSKDMFIKILEKNKTKLLNMINDKVYSFIRDVNLYDLVNNINNVDNNNIDLNIAVGLCEKYVNDKLDILIDKYSHMELYDIFNSINKIENIHSSTSEALKKLTIDNLDSLLQSFIKALSVNNLNKLNDEELCEMAKSFMGNNLKPIMYFGGMLGVIAGVLLSVFQSTPNLLEPFSLSSTITYALVGYLTNAIAINMLFKPYNEIKAIKNIPLLKHLSMGYIPKNKTVLADSMSHAIDSYLLSKESLNELFDKYESSIKETLTDNIAKDNFSSVKNIFDKNVDNIVNLLNKALYNYISDNKKDLSDMMFKQLNKIDLVNLIEDKKDCLLKLYTKNNVNITSFVSDKLCVGISNFASSKNNIFDFTSNVINDKIHLMTKKLIQDNYDMLCKNLNYSSVKNFVLKYETNYNDFIDETICNFIPNIASDKVNLLINNSISKLLYDEIITKKLISSINNNLSSNIALDEILGGRIKIEADNFLGKYYNNAQSIAKELLSNYRFKVSLIVQKKITENMNFLVRGAYAMVNGDKIVSEAVSKFMCDKLPMLINNKKDMLFKDILNFVGNNLLKTNLSELNINVCENSATNIVQSMYKSNNINLDFLCNSLIDCVITKTQNTTFKQLFAPLGLDSINSIFYNNKSIIENFIKTLNYEFDNNKLDVESILYEISSNLTDDTLKNTKIADIFDNIEMSNIVLFTDNLAKIIFNDNEIEKIFEFIIEQLNNNECKLTINKILDEDVFNDISIKTLDKLLDNKLIKEEIQNTLHKILIDFSEDNFKIINTETKDYLVNLVTDASILSLRNNLTTILKDIEFDKIAKEQVNAMSAKKIHKMFNSFAGKYFRTLMFYGLFGAVFGINTIFGLALSGMYVIKSICGTKDKKHKKK